MDNFVKDLDRKYEVERAKSKNNLFVYNIPCKVHLYGKTNDDYIIRKGKFTKFIYVKNGCRVYFTDADILMMLLQIQKSSTMDSFLLVLKKAYNQEEMEKYSIRIEDKEYRLYGLKNVSDEQILKNPQDIDITFNDLLILINLILSKDQASNDLWSKKTDFFKHTLSKYISLIKYYYYHDEKAEVYLKDMGYNVEANIYSNYDTTQKRDDKRGFFSNFEKFEKAEIL